MANEVKGVPEMVQELMSLTEDLRSKIEEAKRTITYFKELEQDLECSVAEWEQQLEENEKWLLQSTCMLEKVKPFTTSCIAIPSTKQNLTSVAELQRTGGEQTNRSAKHDPALEHTSGLTRGCQSQESRPSPDEQHQSIDSLILNDVEVKVQPPMPNVHIYNIAVNKEPDETLQVIVSTKNGLFKCRTGSVFKNNEEFIKINDAAGEFLVFKTVTIQANDVLVAVKQTGEFYLIAWKATVLALDDKLKNLINKLSAINLEQYCKKFLIPNQQENGNWVVMPREVEWYIANKNDQLSKKAFLELHSSNCALIFIPSGTKSTVRPAFFKKNDGVMTFKHVLYSDVDENDIPYWIHKEKDGKWLTVSSSCRSILVRGGANPVNPVREKFEIFLEKSVCLDSADKTIGKVVFQSVSEKFGINVAAIQLEHDDGRIRHAWWRIREPNDKISHLNINLDFMADFVKRSPNEMLFGLIQRQRVSIYEMNVRSSGDNIHYVKTKTIFTSEVLPGIPYVITEGIGKYQSNSGKHFLNLVSVMECYMEQDEKLLCKINVDELK